MGIMEIVLIIVGSIILVLSFVLPANGKENPAEQMPKVDEGLVRELIEKEIKNAKSHIDDVVDETITYSMEKTERAMERLTNEKIMAVSEYSEQILEAMNKNHQEVIFLYDMLNDKHEKLVNTVSEASKKAQEIKQTVQDAEITVKEAVDSGTEKPAEKKTRKTRTQGNRNRENDSADEKEIQTEAQNPADGKAKTQKTTRGRKRATAEESAAVKTDTADNAAVAAQEADFTPISPKKVEVVNGVIQEETDNFTGYGGNSFAGTEKEPEEKTYNNNEKILRLHKLGKSKTAIAKELGLGVGEVKLVIDLFEQS